MGILKSDFLLASDIIFLNHASFGACPRKVFEVYQDLQRQLEHQPVRFFGEEMNKLEKEARRILADYLKTLEENLVFIPNATHGVNIIVRSLTLGPGDEILTTDHEYGACNSAWEFICKRTGAKYIHRPIKVPVRSEEDIIEQLWEGVTSRTRVIYFSHITAPTALCLPAKAICSRARQAGIFTLIDGAHAPGQIALNLEEVDADWYVGNLHKWALCPKGAAFLYARPDVQNLVEPLVVSFGYQATPESTRGSQFQDYLGWTGTKDPAASLSVPSAIRFMQQNHWDQVRKDCHDLLSQTIQRICNFVQMEPLYPLESNLYHQMGIAPLPMNIDLPALRKRLYEDYCVEIPVIDWNGRKGLRISVQGYNTPDDLNTLYEGLRVLIPTVRY